VDFAVDIHPAPGITIPALWRRCGQHEFLKNTGLPLLRTLVA
jgi:hypothetical protein